MSTPCAAASRRSSTPSWPDGASLIPGIQRARPVRVTIEAPIRPTEDPERVLQAVRQIFPDSAPKVEGSWVRGRASGIKMMLKKAGDERVMDAARGALWRGRLGETGTRFELNKQAAFMGRINFNEVSHPLGDLVVTIETDDLDALLDRISPPTAAEVAHREGHAKKRAALHKEEQALEAMGGDIDTGFDELDALDEELPDDEEE